MENALKRQLAALNESLARQRRALDEYVQKCILNLGTRKALAEEALSKIQVRLQARQAKASSERRDLEDLQRQELAACESTSQLAAKDPCNTTYDPDRTVEGDFDKAVVRSDDQVALDEGLPCGTSIETRLFSVFSWILIIATWILMATLLGLEMRGITFRSGGVRVEPSLLLPAMAGALAIVIGIGAGLRAMSYYLGMRFGKGEKPWGFLAVVVVFVLVAAGLWATADSQAFLKLSEARSSARGVPPMSPIIAWVFGSMIGAASSVFSALYGWALGYNAGAKSFIKGCQRRDFDKGRKHRNFIDLKDQFSKHQEARKRIPRQKAIVDQLEREVLALEAERDAAARKVPRIAEADFLPEERMILKDLRDEISNLEIKIEDLKKQDADGFTALYIDDSDDDGLSGKAVVR